MSVTSILMQAMSLQNSTARSEEKALVVGTCAVEEDIVGGGVGFREGMRPCGDWEEDEHRCASDGISMLVEFPGFSTLRLAVNFPEKLPYMSVDMYLL